MQTKLDTEMNGNKCVIWLKKLNVTIHIWRKFPPEMESIVSRSNKLWRRKFCWEILEKKMQANQIIWNASTHGNCEPPENYNY